MDRPLQPVYTQATSTDDSEYVLGLLQSARELEKQFQRNKHLPALDKAIELYQNLLRLHPQDLSTRSEILLNLGRTLRSRFDHANQMQDLSGAILRFREGIECMDSGRGDRWRILQEFSFSLRARFNRRGSEDDLNEVIVVLEEAIQLCPQDSSQYSFLLNSLGRSYKNRYERTGRVSTLDQAIAIFRQTLQYRPVGHDYRPTALSDLANCLKARFKRCGEKQNLDDAVWCQREALKLCPADDPNRNRWTILSNLGNALLALHENFGNGLDWLDEAIGYQRQAVECCPANQPNPLANLASALRHRFSSLGQDCDLEEAILLQRKALELCPEGHPGRWNSLNNLANSLSDRYDSEGRIEDLDEAITKYREALVISHSMSNGPDHVFTVNNLGLALGRRYDISRNEQDLSDAIQTHREALELRPLGHLDRWMSLSHLGMALTAAYSHYGGVEYLNEAIHLHKRSLEQCPDSSSTRTIVYNNLASSLRDRYEESKDASDLDESIKFHRKSLELHPENSPSRSSSLYNLALLYGIRFNHMRQPRDLQETIAFYRLINESLHAFHPLHCRARSGLAQALMCENPNLEEPFELFEKAVNHVTASPQDRLDAAVSWAQTARKRSHKSIIMAYSQALTLLDRCLTTNPTVELQHQLLKRMPKSLATDAASAAIAEGRLETAVELVEQGRGLLWARLTRYRQPVDALREVDAALADEFEHSCRALEQLATSSTTKLQGSQPYALTQPTGTLDAQMAKLHTVTRQWDDTLDRIRAVDGFSNFLRVLPFTDLQKAAANGPVIIVNVSEYRCDAIIVSGSQPPVLVPLPKVTVGGLSALSAALASNLSALHRDIPRGSPDFHDTTENRSFEGNRKEIYRILRSMWYDIVFPIVNKLEDLGLKRHSRIWWCPTSVLCQLPIHASGSYTRGEKNLGDLYVSSWLTTLSHSVALQSGVDANCVAPIDLLVICQPGEPDSSNFLDSVEKEACEIMNIASQMSASSQSVAAEERKQEPCNLLPLSSMKVIVGEGAVPETVLSLLPRHSWVHFACHAHQDAKPLQSRFKLHNNSKVALSDFIKLQTTNAEFAFLSACDTAKGDVEGTVDEVIHLAATMQFCGFQGVVGTLWPMDDRDGPTMTRYFYEEMLNHGNGSNYRHAATALHRAVRRMRKDKEPPTIDRWINFVHFGA